MSDYIKSENLIYNKSFRFAVKIVNIYKQLSIEKREFVLSKQLLRSGTSIGANVSESGMAQSKKDFINKLHIAFKEAGETEYWLNLLMETGILEKDKCNELLTDVKELIRILNSIIKTSKNRIKNNE